MITTTPGVLLAASAASTRALGSTQLMHDSSAGAPVAAVEVGSLKPFMLAGQLPSGPRLTVLPLAPTTLMKQLQSSDAVTTTSPDGSVNMVMAPSLASAPERGPRAWVTRLPGQASALEHAAPGRRQAWGPLTVLASRMRACIDGPKAASLVMEVYLCHRPASADYCALKAQPYLDVARRTEILETGAATAAGAVVRIARAATLRWRRRRGRRHSRRSLHGRRRRWREGRAGAAADLVLSRGPVAVAEVALRVPIWAGPCWADNSAPAPPDARGVSHACRHGV